MKAKNRFVFAVVGLVAASILGLGLWLWLSFQDVRALQVATSFGGASNNESVHGFGILAQWLRRNGHQVTRTGILTNQVDRYDVVIWTHKGPQLPNDEAVERLEQWMAGGGTVVFIGHDYDTTLDYWRCVYQESRGADRLLARWAYLQEKVKSLTHADVGAFPEFTDSTSRTDYFPGTENRWMSVAGDNQPKAGYWQSIGSNSSWEQAGPAPDPTAVELGSDISPPIVVRSWFASKSKDARVLAKVQHEGVSIPVMYREQLPQRAGRAARDLWVISHPVFLVNFGILRPENVPLREAFFDALPPQSRVLFLETGPGDVQLSTTPNERIDQSWAWMTKGPFPIFVLHTVLLAMVYCFARFPVFGRPRKIQFAPRNDFGQHLAEVGRLLRVRKLETYAREKIAHYYQAIRRGTRK